MKSQRFEWMDTLRGIAMLLVVVLHAGLALNYYADSYPRVIEIFNLAFQPFRMPTLMFLSGMLLNKSLSKPAPTYFEGKGRKLLWPYLVWTAIALTAQGDISAYTLGRAVYNPVETHLWYLWFLLIFYTIAFVIKPIPFWIPGLIALAASQFLTEDFRLEKMAFLFAFFMFGKVYSEHADKLSRFNRPLILVAVFAVGAIASGFNIAHWKVLYEPAYVVPVVCGLFLAICLVPRIPASKARSALQYLGRNSLILYVVHLIAIKSAGTVLGNHGLTNPWVLFPVLLAIGIGTSVVFMLLRDQFTAVGWLFELPSRKRQAPPQVQEERRREPEDA
ncbi:acyltransferase [Gordonia phage Petra]|uniref:Acetyltransferase n=3 Tax=root TaxID=1 RepID=A0A2U8UL36_9CAUD|nr:acyltransferase [Gordonia phage Petra]AWN04146.1 acetyltransferase [Gordonia phage Petra]